MLGDSQVEPAFERAFPWARKATKRHVLHCALACFDEAGLDAVTIDDIKKKSGNSTGTIYHHFGSKEGLASAIYLAALDDQQVGFEAALHQAKTARDAVKAWVNIYVGWVVANPRLARFMFQARKSVAAGTSKAGLKERNDKRFGALHSFLRHAVQAGEVRPLPAETYPSLLIGPSENYCRAWLSGRVSTSPMEHVDVLADAAWRSIAVNPSA